MESARAAIEMGADAIYLGLQKFNARANAGNFTEEELKECIEYAHLLDVKVFLVSNTLVNQQELNAAVDQIETAYKLGIDAVILQDLGLAARVHSRMPALPMHASTQMTIYNKEAALVMKAMGFSRVILARECGIQDIKDICQACGDDMEVEVFVHGAVCVSYSGQCLMSAMLANRSGNRGQCAQLCRMCYSIDNNKNAPPYLLSPKDLCLLDRLDELAEAGVCCLKIEGRMKTPEYVGAVAKVYRRKLDGMGLGTDRQELLQAFNRNGFTELYYATKSGANKPGLDQMSSLKPKNWGLSLGKILAVRKDFDRSSNMKFTMVSVKLSEKVSLGDGIEIMTGGTTDDPGTVVTEIIGKNNRQTSANVGETVWIGRLPQDSRIQVGMELRKTGDAESRKAIIQQVQAGKRKRPIAMDMVLEEGGYATLTVRAGDVVATGREQILAPTDTPRSYIERLKQQLAKTGSTPFVVQDIRTYGEPEGFLVVSQINSLRRQVLDDLAKAIISKELGERTVAKTDEIVWPEPLNVENTITTVCVRDAKEALAASKTGEYTEYILPIKSLFSGEYKDLEESGLAYRFKFPSITRGSVDRQLRTQRDAVVEAIASPNCRGVIISNIGQLWLSDVCHQYGKTVTADYCMNIFNVATAKAYVDLGVDYFYPSVEVEGDLDFMDQLCTLFYGRVEMRNHGFIPLMTSDFCPVGAYLGGKKDCGTMCSRPCTKGNHVLTDGRGRTFPVVCDRLDCRTQIMSNVKIENPAILGGEPMGVRSIRQDIDYSEHLLNGKHI